MPIYVYTIIEADGSDGETFEVLQGMNEPALTEHPTTGQPVRRIIGVPQAPRKWTSQQAQSDMSSKNLERLGFTQYKKAGDGKYEKTAGQGPDVISGDGN